MYRAKAEGILAALGYKIDWSVTGQAESGWAGTIDAVGRSMIDGDCRGEVVTGDSAEDFYNNAIEAARNYGVPKPCPHAVGDCPFHDED